MAIPTDGLVFYAPLAESKATAETGQTLNVTGSISYQSIDGIPCAYFDSSSIETKNNFTEISGSNSTFTASIWGCMPNGYNGVQTLLFFGGDDGNGYPRSTLMTFLTI